MSSVAPHAPAAAATDADPDTVADVIVLRWPGDARERARLSAAGVARLLLVEPGADPPDGGDCEEDWIRLPADDRDVAARLHALSVRADRHRPVPVLDPFGRLLHRGDWIGLSPTEEGLIRPLVDRFAGVVPYDELLRSAWPDAAATHNALRVHLYRLRRRIAPLHLDLRSVRGNGVVLEDRPQ